MVILTCILEGVDKYIAKKQYNIDCADNILSALCNALGTTATVYQYKEESVTEIKQTPRRPGVAVAGVIHIALHGSKAGVHYIEVSKCSSVQPEDETTESIARKQTKEVLVQIPKTFTPEHIRPFPKVPAKQQTTKERKMLKSAILTDTPEKALDEEFRISTAEIKEGRESGKESENAVNYCKHQTHKKTSK